MIDVHHRITAYTIGFVASLTLTLFSFIIVLVHIASNNQLLPLWAVVGIILTIAFIQLFVQLVCFLHLGEEKGPKWNIGIFIATFTAVLTIVAASIWIMDHLNYNMTPQQQLQYIQNQSSI